ncbi:hypothetical protein LKD70_09125 [Ruminococcus sp. CLA-AA-H200]|uniref:Phage protein n=1 Tax=Ruminococcus turbiniformis TaxID=2881258 RepID=A0ABS8FX15_9FIRM|nr:hypothetical protein [Ruminococcus turbiniformis]MCC2254576.1 hypothetical protein [Ruminococcus turbiniformis]
MEKKDYVFEVLNKADELLLLCQKYRIPMFVTVVTDINNNGEPQYYNRMFSAKGHGISLSDDQIEKHVLVADGFKVVPPREHIELDMSEFLQPEDE